MEHSIQNKTIVLFSDGGARGNPGPSAIGVVMNAEDSQGNLVLVGEVKQYIGEHTNNFAEYTAVITGMEEALRLGYAHAKCFLDSELVVKQINGQYKVREATLQKLHTHAKQIASKFESITFTHVRREKNAGADKLVNQALDERAGLI